MITGILKNRSRYEQLGENYKKAFDWLENNDICSLEDGCYPIDGENIYAYVQRYNTMDKKAVILKVINIMQIYIILPTEEKGCYIRRKNVLEQLLEKTISKMI